MVIPRRFVLVLDDYHLITTHSILSDLAFLLEHMPPQMHIILLSRGYPPFSLSRMRTHGQIGELDTTDLRFTAQEVAEFVKEVMSIDIPIEEITTLEIHTEGWAAGLRLAGLSFAKHKLARIGTFISAFTNYHHYIFDYLADEVFLHRPEYIQTFLLQTSILDRLHGSLCDAVTGNSYSHLLLKQLKQAGVFLISLDEDDQWYRYHYLFTEFLRSRITELTYQNTGEISLATLHNRASIWYQQHGMRTEAIAHALASDESAHASSRFESEHLEAMQDQDTYSSSQLKLESQHETVPSLLDSLSTREFEVLQCLAEGMSNIEIAKKMVIAEVTVKWHLRNIYSKLDVHNRNQAMLKARKLTE